MKKILLVPLCLIFTCAFGQDKINKGFKTYKVFPGKRLSMEMSDSFGFSAEVQKGNMLLFEYHYQADEYADMTDDEYSERILFALPANTGSFELTGSKLQAAYLRSCFCMDRGWHRVNEGFIRGKKINSKTWDVEIGITTEKEKDRSAGPIIVDAKGKFVLQPTPKKVIQKKKKAHK